VAVAIWNFDILCSTPILPHMGAIPLNDANGFYSEKCTVLKAKTSYIKNISQNMFIEIQVGTKMF